MGDRFVDLDEDDFVVNVSLKSLLTNAFVR